MNKKPIALWLTDTHLASDTIPIVKDIFGQVAEICLELGIPGIIHGGDVFDSRKGQPQDVLTAFGEIISVFQSVDLNVIVIGGNHDKSSYIGEDSFLDAYAGWDKFFLFKNYQHIDFSETNIRFHFIPYFDEQLAYESYLLQALSNIQLGWVNILFTHIAVSGVKNNDGSLIANNLNFDSFKQFTHVLVGHYHNRQVIGNVIYTGSCYQANFGEDDKKGCTIIFDDGSLKFVPLTFPRYITHLKETPNQEVEINEGDINKHRIKVKYKPSPSEIAEFNKMNDVKIVYDFTIEHSDHIQDVKTVLTATDIEQYFEQWCEDEGVDDKEFGIKQLQL